MAPYKEPLASQELEGYRQFNQGPVEARVKIEHSFGVLKKPLGVTLWSAN